MSESEAMSEWDTEYSNPEGLAVGDRVTYHGSLKDYHGIEYTITGMGAYGFGHPNALTLMDKFGLSVLHNARPKSVTKVESNGKDAR